MFVIEETDDRYYAAPSTLPNAGHGCFAKVPLKKDDWLEVSGVMVKNDGVADFCTRYANRYKFSGSKRTAKIVPMGWAALVNHTDDPTKQNCELTCIAGVQKRSEHSSEIVYVFLRDIEPGEELLGNYGDKLSRQITKDNENMEFLQANESDWEVFLKYNLYDLKRLCEEF